MLLAFAYPFMKRITYWPQLFLGITFNWGIIMSWAAINADITQEIILLYLSAIFWTLGYDTIYGTQDMSEDEIIGLKSTAIKFKDNIKLFVTTSYLIAILIILYLFKDSIGFNISSLFVILFILSLTYQIVMFKKNKLYLTYFNNINAVGNGICFFLLIKDNRTNPKPFKS